MLEKLAFGALGGAKDALFNGVKEIVDKFLPNMPENDKEAVTIQMSDKALELSTQIALQQIEVNKIDAKSDKFIQYGWRPMAGWTGVAGFIYYFLFRPIANGIINFFTGVPETFLAIDITALMTLLGGLLGFGGYRMFERLKGKA